MLQPFPASHNGWKHSVKLLLRRLSLQDDVGWDYEKTQKSIIDDANDQILESIMTPAHAFRQKFIPLLYLTNTISCKCLTNNSKDCLTWMDKVDSGKILHNNFHPGNIKISLRHNVWWYGCQRHAIYKLLQKVVPFILANYRTLLSRIPLFGVLSQ